MRYRTYQLKSGSVYTLSGVDQTVNMPSQLANLGANMANQVVFHFKLSSNAGDNVTITPEEFYSYRDETASDVESVFGTTQAGWGNIAKDDGTGVLTKQQFTADGAAAINNFSVSLATTAAKIRLKVQGQGTLKVWVTVAKVS